MVDQRISLCFGLESRSCREALRGARSLFGRMSLRLHPETAEVFHNGKVSVSLGTCKLCLEDKELCKSHFMPQALFDLCRAPGLEPVVLTQKVIMQTSRQTTD